MTTYVSAAIVASVARKAAVESAIAALTPSYTIALTGPVCAEAEGVTWETPPTHYYTNAESVDIEIAAAWQMAAKGSLPAGFTLPYGSTLTEQDIIDGLIGIPVWTGANVANANSWADANLAPEGLMRVPPNNNV